jgi:vancomycin resistance protein YoaR
MPVDDYYQGYSSPRRRNQREAPLRDDKLLDDLLSDEPTGRLAPPRAAPRARGRRRRRSVLAPFLFFLALLAAGVLAFPYALDVYYADRVLPGVRVQGVNVQGVSREALRAALATRYADFLDRPLTLTYGDQVWQPGFKELGVRFDADSAVRDVLAAGRTGGPVARLQALWALWWGGLDVAPRLVVDARTTQQYLVTLAPTVEQPPRDAALSVAEGKVIGTPSAAGRQLLAPETTNDTLLALRTLSPQTVALRTRELAPTVGDATLARAQGTAQTLLSSPLTLVDGDRSWTWTSDKLADFLRVEPRGTTLAVELDSAKLTKATERLAQLADSGSVEPRLRFAEGGLQIIQEGQAGKRLKQPEAIAAISQTLTLNQAITRTLALPMEAVSPQITADKLATLGIVELIGEGRSSFEGSADYRITNIKAGAARMDGVLIPPDSEFSFNTQLGDVDAANGFVEGYAVVDSRTQLEWGGGVCQDSTTVFRAAFWAGLPITERYAHPFYISWYDRFGFADYGDGAGLDATIYTGVNDFKFANNTGHWILMQAEVDDANQILTVRLYGTKDRTVEFAGPEITNEQSAPETPRVIDDSSKPAGYYQQTDTARGGRDIVVYRTVTVNGVRGETEAFWTRFKAWPNVFVRGTGG